MSMERIQRYTQVGIDVAGGAARMGNNVDFFEKYLLRFPQDMSFAKLRQALQVHDAKEAELHAHTLKGFSACMGMQALSEACSELVQLLRMRAPDAQVRCAFEMVEQQYDRVMRAFV